MRCTMSLALALVGAGVLASSVQALVVAPPPGPQKFLTADAMFVGRVTGMEPTDVEMNGAKVRVAVLQVSEIVSGLKAGTKTVRVGFFVPDENPKFPRTGRQSPRVEIGQDGLFALNKFPGKDKKLFMAPNFGNFVPAAAGNFKNELAEAKKAAAIMQDPVAVMKSGGAADQLMAAHVLVTRYRNVPAGANPQTAKQEPIDAEESKLILKTIASANWNAPGRFGALSPLQVWSQLGVAAKDGWTQPKQFDMPKIGQAVQEWVRANGETYHIQRYVAVDNTK